MRRVALFALIGTFLGCSSSKSTGDAKSQDDNWFPMKVGNYWVYEESVVKNEDVVKSRIDTIKIIEEFDYQGFMAYKFSNGETYYKKGEDIYQIYQSGSGDMTSSLAYKKISKKGAFQHTQEGDQVFERRATEVDELYKYVVDNCGSEIQIKKNVGIFKTVKTNCNSPITIVRTKTLLNHKLK